MSTLELIEIASDIVPGPVECAVILPPDYSIETEPLPLCLNLHGGGSSRESLIAAQPRYDAAWASGEISPMVMVMASSHPMSFYFDDPEGDQWETFITEELPAYMHANYNVRTDRDGTVMTGGSMGGYGTLKIAFKHPDRYCAIAALEPCIEPGFDRASSPLRSQIYTVNASADASAKVVGPDPDLSLFEANSPARRLKDNASAVRDSGMAIYLECGDQDVLNLHDGTEFLHRLLWDLDIAHEYHLVKDADHVGPSLGRRSREALVFLSEALQKVSQSAVTTPEPSESARAWIEWMQGDMKEEGPVLNMASEDGIAALRFQFGPVRKETEKHDPTASRRYAVLPPTDVSPD
jgi:S-formylglutathione hydrolase